MTRHLRIFTIAWALTFGHAAAAQPVAGPDAATKEHAKQLFDAGNTHLSAGETESALAAFLESRALYPTRGNTLNAALLLHRLGRHDEALELYLELARTFPLNAAEKEQVDREVGLLRELTGRLDVTTEPGATLTVDGRARGQAPFTEPLIVLSGKRSVRVTAPGRAPLEASIVVNGGQTVLLTARLTPEAPGTPPGPLVPEVTTAPSSDRGVQSGPEPTPKSDDSGVVLSVSVGPAISPGFGGPLADSCGSGCSTHLPFGFQGLVRGGYRFPSGLEASFELGWTRLSGRYEDRPDVLEPTGSGPQQGRAEDDLAWTGTLLGLHGGWSRGDVVSFRIGLGAGFAFGTVRDHRRGRYDVNPPTGDPYTASVDDEQTARGASFYIAPEVGVGLRLSRAFELHADLSLFTAIGLSAVRYENGSGVVVRNGTGSPELATLRNDELVGAPFFAFVPRLGVTFRP